MLKAIPLFLCTILSLWTIVDARPITSSDNGIITITYINTKNETLQLKVDISIFNTTPSNCSDNATYCLKWPEGRFQITEKGSNCEQYEFTNNHNEQLTVSFNTSKLFLYGGPILFKDTQIWPSNFMNFDKLSFWTKSTIYEYYWLISNGMYLYVDHSTPLFVTQNKRNTLKFIAEKKTPYIRNGPTNMSYTICTFEDMKQAHKHAVDNVLGKPSDLPDISKVPSPAWETWYTYGDDVNSTEVLEFADLINKHHHRNPNTEFLIWGYAICNDDMTIPASTRFPNMTETVSKLNQKDFQVSLWTYSYIPPCSNISQYFIINGTELDYTNVNVTNRLKKSHDELVKMKINSFDFFPLPLPNNTNTFGYHLMRDDHPETNIKKLAEFASGYKNKRIYNAVSTQKYPTFVSLLISEPTWNGNNSLSTIIPKLLQMNIIGYPYASPPPVASTHRNKTVSEELFIRWLQANVFMPTLLFSYPPWKISKKAIDMTNKFTSLHKKYSDKIIAAMRKSVEHGTPVNPPIWWIDPNDPQTYVIDDEYLLGEDILVAPVIKQGATSRDIYLPKGTWQDEVGPTPALIKGPIWLRKYPAGLEVLPYFTKVN